MTPSSPSSKRWTPPAVFCSAWPTNREPAGGAPRRGPSGLRLRRISGRPRASRPATFFPLPVGGDRALLRRADGRRHRSGTPRRDRPATARRTSNERPRSRRPARLRVVPRAGRSFRRSRGRAADADSASAGHVSPPRMPRRMDCEWSACGASRPISIVPTPPYVEPVRIAAAGGDHQSVLAQPCRPVQRALFPRPTSRRRRRWAAAVLLATRTGLRQPSRRTRSMGLGTVLQRRGHGPTTREADRTWCAGRSPSPSTECRR